MRAAAAAELGLSACDEAKLSFREVRLAGTTAYPAATERNAPSQFHISVDAHVKAGMIFRPAVAACPTAVVAR